MVRKMVDEQLRTRDLVQRKELGVVSEKLESVEWELRLMREEMKGLKQEELGLSKSQ
jgi:hypothetical protein